MCKLLDCKADRTKWLKRDLNEISFDQTGMLFSSFVLIGRFIVYLHVLLHLIGWFCCQHVRVGVSAQLVHCAEEFTAVLHSHAFPHSYTHLLQQCGIMCKLLPLRQSIYVTVTNTSIYTVKLLYEIEGVCCIFLIRETSSENRKHTWSAHGRKQWCVCVCGTWDRFIHACVFLPHRCCGRLGCVWVVVGVCMCLVPTLRRLWKAVVCIIRGRCATMACKQCSCNSVAKDTTCFAHFTSGKEPISCSVPHSTDTEVCTVWKTHIHTFFFFFYIQQRHITPPFHSNTQSISSSIMETVHTLIHISVNKPAV